ncbi:hypothetical protein V1294_006829 [Bradyrhizobium sp. AZCC 1678]|uniref:hypothetical protein n=1 Tax=Bradyrhizobium sp. AZCC 1678 TaxID=3117030 RepID=UPI002FF0DF79
MQVQSVRDLDSSGSFSTFIQALEGVFSSEKTAIGPAEYDVFDAIVSRGLAGANGTANFLQEAAQHIRQDRLIRGNSHQHAHGFTKLALYRSSVSGFSVRLHIWWTGVQAFDDSPHEHRWSFYSKLLSGSLRIRNFVEPRPGSGVPGAIWYRYKYADATADGKKCVEADGAATLTVASEYIMFAGSSHTLAPTEPHQVFGQDGAIAATLVITAPPARSYSNVYHEQPTHASSYSFGEQRLNNVQVAQLIERYCAFLNVAA